MKKVTLVVVCLILVFLISACSNVNLPGFLKKGDKPSVGRGVRLFFADDNPPRDKIYVIEGKPFLVRVGIENFGKEIDDFELTLWDSIPGKAMEDFQSEATIDAANFRYNERGDEITAIFPSITLTKPHRVEYKEDDIVSGTKVNIFAELYIRSYDVSMDAGICFKKETELDPSCSNKETITQSQLEKTVSYVPVTVEKIEKTVTPLGEDNYFADLRITFRNLGGGRIVPIGGERIVPIGGESLDEETIDRLGQVMSKPRVELYGGGKVDCSPELLVFDNDMATLTCFIEGITSEQPIVMRRLIIEYGFGYKLRAKVGPIPLIKMEDLERGA